MLGSLGSFGRLKGPFGSLRNFQVINVSSPISFDAGVSLLVSAHSVDLCSRHVLSHAFALALAFEHEEGADDQVQARVSSRLAFEVLAQ